MTFMVGIGPFVVIPFVIQAMHGPQMPARLGGRRAAGAFDGCIWAELGAAMPQAGGSYVFLREAYGPGRWGRLMSFLFIWQTLFQGPLSIASGALGFADYSLVSHRRNGSSNRVRRARRFMFAPQTAIAVVVILLIVIAVVLLYRRIPPSAKSPSFSGDRAPRFSGSSGRRDSFR